MNPCKVCGNKQEKTSILWLTFTICINCKKGSGRGNFLIDTFSLNLILDWFHKIKMACFRKEDFSYPCRVFSMDCYTGHYGCHIQRANPGEDSETVYKGDTVVWHLTPSIHPKMYIGKDFRYF